MNGDGRRAARLLFAVAVLIAILAVRRGDASDDAPPAAQAVAAPPETTRIVWRAGEARAELFARPESLRFRLPHPWIDPATLRLFRHDTLLVRGVDFLLDPRRGTARLVRPRGETERLRAEYRYFPAPLRPEFRRRVLTTGPRGGDGTAEPPPVSAAAPVEDVGDAVRFDLTGSKTVAVEVGSERDLALRQSLDLAVDGRIGRDVRVRAVLTDRRSPLEPESGGESARLSDLDRILVEVEGPSARMTMGELRLQAPPSEFARYDRRLEGVRGELTGERIGALAAAASVPGDYVMREFYGEEGKQGPYALSAPGALGEGAIVPGSDRIYLDGVLLQRGETADYRIDEAAATITFTGRRAITAYSEIRAEYQISRERYRRHAYAAGGSFGTAAGTGPGKVRALLLWEGDDRERPLIPLAEGQRESLAVAGDSLTPGLDSGITFAGPGRGEYDLVTNDTLRVSFFLYQGPDRGAYIVRFDAVGDGQGDYRDTTDAGGRRFYRYVGERRGAYLPGAAVPRPERSALAVVAAEPDLGTRWRLRTEAAWSDHDPNTISARDDEDNQGGALRVDAGAGPFAAGPARMTVSISWREVGSRFRPLERLDAPFYARDWSVASDRLQEGSRRRSGGLEASLGSWRGRGTWEDLDNRLDFRGERGIFELDGRTGPLEWRGRALRAVTRDELQAGAERGERATERIQATWAGGWATLSGGWNAERDERGRGGFRRGGAFDEWNGKLGTGERLAGLQASAGWTRRERRAFEGTDSRLVDVGDTGLFDARWMRTGGKSLEGSYTVRVLTPRGEGARTETRLGRVRWVERDRADRIRQEGRWELGTSVRGGREKEIRRVADGAGRYDSLGVFVGIGDYEIYYRELPESTRVHRIDFTLRSEFDAGRGDDSAPSSGGVPLWGRVRRSLRVVHTWSAAAETERDARWLWERMLPVLAGRRDLPLTEMSMRLDLSTLPDARRLSPRLRAEERRAHRRLLANAGEASRERTAALLLRSRPTERWTAEQETEWNDAEQRTVVEGIGAGGDGWRSWRLRMEQKVRLAKSVSLGLDSSARQRSRVGTDGEARVLAATPYVVWTPGQRSRIEVRSTRTSVERSGAGAAGRLLESPGWDSRAVGTIRLREELDLSLWYRDRRPDRADAVQDGRLELRATF